MAKKPKQRTDEDYIRLDDAIAALIDWSPEICKALNHKGISERALNDVLAAASRVHSPEE